jgi:hypothetical protein
VRAAQSSGHAAHGVAAETRRRPAATTANGTMR